MSHGWQDHLSKELWAQPGCPGSRALLKSAGPGPGLWRSCRSDIASGQCAAGEQPFQFRLPPATVPAPRSHPVLAHWLLPPSLPPSLPGAASQVQPRHHARLQPGQELLLLLGLCRLCGLFCQPPAVHPAAAPAGLRHASLQHALPVCQLQVRGRAGWVAVGGPAFACRRASPASVGSPPACLLHPARQTIAVPRVTRRRCHVILANLRPAGAKGYVIPRGFLFNLITCPNYTAEILGWVGFTVATQTAAAALFTLVGAGQMARWALGKHKRLIKVRRLYVGWGVLQGSGCLWMGGSAAPRAPHTPPLPLCFVCRRLTGARAAKSTPGGGSCCLHSFKREARAAPLGTAPVFMLATPRSLCAHSTSGIPVSCSVCNGLAKQQVVLACSGVPRCLPASLRAHRSGSAPARLHWCRR